MAISEAQQRELISALGAALKATPVASKLDVNKTLFKISSEMPRYLSNDGVDLAPLAQVLAANQGVTAQEIAAICLLMKRKEDRFGFAIKLPRDVEALTESARAALLAEIIKAPTPTPSAPAPRAERPAPSPAPAAAESSPAPARAGAGAKRQRQILLGVLAVAFAAAVGMYLGQSDLKRINPALPPELSGLKVYEQNGVIYFFDGHKDFDRPQAELQTMGKAALAVAQGLGAQEAWFCAEEDNTCRHAAKAVSRPQGLVFIDAKLKAAASH